MAYDNCMDCGIFIGSGPHAEAPAVKFKYQGMAYALCAADALIQRDIAANAMDSTKFTILTRALIRAGVL